MMTSWGHGYKGEETRLGKGVPRFARVFVAGWSLASNSVFRRALKLVMLILS